MVKKIYSVLAIFVLFGSLAVQAQQGKQVTTEGSKTNFKFLSNITIESVEEENPELTQTVTIPSVKKDLLFAARNSEATIETANRVQFKYSLLLDVEVELVKNISLFRLIDEWYGVKYLYGGATKHGIDCSALMQVIYSSIYGVMLPRTARMQYDFSRRISRAELKEGDLLFFNTRGGVSHVGMYLANNKFLHASARGVAISDLFDSYYMNRLIGVGRVLQDQPGTASLSGHP